MAWHWVFLDSEGDELAGAADAVRNGFLTQGDAETWLGDNWRDLVEDGVAAVSLREDRRHVYGPMSLQDVD
ncbi:MAG TPA: hypothetical protein VFZ37_20410 [Jiangellaceae bacterium]